MPLNQPFYQDDAVTLWHGYCLDVLRTLPDASVADDEIEARVFDDFKHTLAAKDAIIAERDETIRRLQGCLDMYTAANTEMLNAVAGMMTETEDLWARLKSSRATIERLTTEHKAAGIHAQVSTDARYAAEAIVERVKALAYAWVPFKRDGSPHWAGCHLVHADCFIYAIRDAMLEPRQNKGLLRVGIPNKASVLPNDPAPLVGIPCDPQPEGTPPTDFDG